MDDPSSTLTHSLMTNASSFNVLDPVPHGTQQPSNNNSASDQRSPNSNANLFNQPQNDSDDVQYPNLASHEQLKLHGITFQATPGVRMQVPTRKNSPNSSNAPNLSAQSSGVSSSTAQQQQLPSSPSLGPQPARVVVVPSGGYIDNADYPLDFSPIPIQYAAVNSASGFMHSNGNLQRKPAAQQATMNRGVMNQAAYPLQYRFAQPGQEQKIPAQYLVQNINPEGMHAVQLVMQQPQQVRQQPQQPQQQQQQQRKRKSDSGQKEESSRQESKRQKRSGNNDENRLVKNRQAAQLFRQRQKQHIKDLEDKVGAVNEVNVALTAKVDVLRAENKLVKDQLQYLRNFVAAALQYAFPQSKEELQKRWEDFQQAETERHEAEKDEEKSNETEPLMLVEEKAEKLSNDREEVEDGN